MKKTLLTLMAALAAVAATAQTMNINKGNVTYAVAAADAGDMTYSGGTTLTVCGKAFNLNDITSIVIDESTVESNTVKVEYTDAGSNPSAKVIIPISLASSVEASVSGGHVRVLQQSGAADGITYTLSGSSSNGSFYMDGNKPSTFVLNGVNLQNPDSCAICIQDGKALTVRVADGTTNTLSDGITASANDGSDAHKAAIYINGSSTWEGSGTVTIKGNVKHGLATDAGLTFANGFGTLTISNAASDGIHANEYVKTLGGTLNITASNDGFDVDKKTSSTSSDNGGIVISGGTVTVTTAGNSNKGMKCEGNFVMSAGTLSVNTSGSSVYEEVAGVGDLSSSACVKPAGTFTMSGGKATLTSTGAGGKGLNATGNITVSGGTLTVVTTGTTFTYSSSLDSKPHGIKTDGEVTLSGGSVYVAASADSGTSIKANYVYTNGSTMMAVGAKLFTPSSTSSHSYKKYTGVNVSAGQTLSYDGVTFTVPSSYSNSSARIVVSSSSM